MGGALSFLGSGEFLDWNSTVDRWLIESASTGNDRVLILPTASAPEGDDIFDKWGRMGVDYFERLGASPVVVPLKSKGDAEDPGILAYLDQAALVYFSGGNPAHLVRTLKDTSFWKKLSDGLVNGLSLSGCSAGINMLGGRSANSSATDPSKRWAEGLSAFPKFIFGPHWDRLERYRPGAKELMISSVPEGWTLVGIDENTSMYGDGAQWKVNGQGRVSIYRGQGGETIEEFQADRSFVLDLKSTPKDGAGR